MWNKQYAKWMAAFQLAKLEGRPVSVLPHNPRQRQMSLSFKEE